MLKLEQNLLIQRSVLINSTKSVGCLRRKKEISFRKRQDIFKFPSTVEAAQCDH
jgi:hypothetical protein